MLVTEFRAPAGTPVSCSPHLPATVCYADRGRNQVAQVLLASEDVDVSFARNKPDGSDHRGWYRGLGSG